MKKLMLMKCASAFAGLMAVAETETVNGVEWYYEVKDGHAVLGGGYNVPAISKDAEGKIVIPEKLGGYAVTDISSFAFSAWRTWRDKITSVTIPNSVTNIDSYAFSGCRELAGITIPNGMKSIGRGAFHNCKRLSSLALPESVTKIGERAFKGCDGLATNGFVIVRNVLYSYVGDDSDVIVPDGVMEISRDTFEGNKNIREVTLPNGLKSIGEDAFSRCEKLTNVILPSTLTDIGDCAFQGCRNLSSTAIPDSVKTIGSRAFAGCDGLATNGFVIVRGVLYSYSGSSVVVAIPDGVMEIGDDVFKGNTNVCKVTLPNGITRIGRRAFEDCKRLTSVVLPEGVTHVGYCAFGNCVELANMTIPSTMTNIEHEAFGWCSKATFSVAEGNPRYVVVDGMLYDKIEDMVVRGISGLGDVVLPPTTKIVAPNAFSGCGGITRVTVPCGVAHILDEAFQGCTNLTHISLPTTVTNIGWEVFSDCPIHTFEVDKANERYAEYNGLLYDKKEDAVIRGTMPLREIAFPSTTKTINWRAFEGCTNLVDVVIPKSVSEIHDDAFKNCTALEKVRIEQGAAIDELREVFGGCVKLRHIDLGDSIKSLVNNIFSGCVSLERVEIPDSVETMECGVFLDCTNLTYVKIGKNLQVPDNDYFSYNFEGCKSLETIEIDPANASLCVVDGFVYSKDRATLLFCPCAATKDTLVIPDGVTVVADIVSRGCDVLQKVIVPHSVTNMGKTASRAKLFTEYVVDERNKFYSSVGGLLLDKKVETLVACASGCKGHMQVPETVRKIKDEAFALCEGITSVMIPDRVTKIGWNAFYGCKGLKKVSLPKALKGKINEKDVFRRCADDLKIVYRD